MDDQNHPLYAADRKQIDLLLGKDSPQDEHIVELARLLVRYEGFPGALDLHEDMIKILKQWRMTREQLNSQARAIWGDGYRPGMKTDEAVGSGFDTAGSGVD